MPTDPSKTPEQIQALQQQNDLYKKQLELQAEGYSLSSSYLESLKEILGIRSRTSVSDGNILDINKKINREIAAQKGIYEKSSDVQKQIIKNKNLIHKASVQELSLSKQLNEDDKNRLKYANANISTINKKLDLLDKEKAKNSSLQDKNLIKQLQTEIAQKERGLDLHTKSMSQTARTLLYTQKQREELEKQNKQREIEKEKLKQVEKTLGISGALMKGMSKIPFLGDLPGMSSVLDDVEKEIKAINEARKEEGKEPVSRAEALKMTFSKMKGVVKDVLTDPAALSAIAFKLIIDALISVDKGAGDLAKGFNMTYNEAMNVREELTQIGNLSGDAALNTRALQESMMAIGKSLGSNAMASQRDLEAMTKLREQAGFTNDELLGIEKTTLATGKNLEDNVSSLLYAAKVTGLNNKVLLNEKDIMRDVAAASDAIKLSLRGSGEKLGAAAAQAKALGMSLSQVDKIAGSLLDFESSINNELSAELITGKDLNLEQARLYALTNDTEGLSRELAKNFGTAAEFGKMNRIQQEAIAKAVGMGREELATTLTDQEALKNLSGDKLKDAQAALSTARAQGMSEKQIAEMGYDNLMKQQSAQERLTMAVEKMKEIFVSIAEPIMAIVSPIMDALLPVLSVISGVVGTIAGGFGTVLKYISPIVVAIASFYAIAKTIMVVQKTMVALQGAYNILTGIGLTMEQKRGLVMLRNGAIAAKNFLKSMYGYVVSAGESVAKIPYIGPVLAIAAISAATAIGYGMYSKMMGDGNFPAEGQGPDRTITSKGTMYKPAKEDNIYVTPQKMVAVGNASFKSNGGATNTSSNQFTQQSPTPVYVTVNPTTPTSGISQIQNQYYTTA